MAACLGMWFLPYVSGPACNVAEEALIRELLKTFGCHSEAAVDSLYWFFRKKMLAINAATYIPFAGVPLQLFETYAIGQFTIHCAGCPNGVSDELWMAQNWQRIEDVILSGEKAVQMYEQSTGNRFPEHARYRFIRGVDAIRTAYKTTSKIPGFVRAQEIAGETIRQGIRAGRRLIERAGASAIQRLKKSRR